MKKIALVDIICFFFILLFVYTGIAKLMEVYLFKEQIISSPFLGSLAGFVTWALPIGELLLAIALFIPVSRLPALYATLVLMTLFTIYVIVLLFMDGHLSCSCGGIIEELSPRQHVLFNSACVILCTMAIAVHRRPQPSLRFKWLTCTSTLCLLLFVGWTLFTAFSTPPTVKTGMEGRLLPSFNLLLPDSLTHLNTVDIPTGKPLIIIGFSPWCIHCQAETRDIIQHIQQFKNARIYYVTPMPFSQMKTFYRYFKLSQYSNITMGQDTTNTFMSYFKAKGVPYIAIFDSKKRLQEALNTQVSATKLAQLAVE